MASHKVLILDGHPADRTHLRQLLPQGNYEIAEASNGQEGLALIHQERGGIRFILLDASLPQVNGWEIIQHLQVDPELNHIPLVIMLQPGDRPQDSDYPFLEVLAKPFERKQLKQVVKSAIQKAKAAPAPPTPELAAVGIESSPSLPDLPEPLVLDEEDDAAEFDDDLWSGLHNPQRLPSDFPEEFTQPPDLPDLPESGNGPVWDELSDSAVDDLEIYTTTDEDQAVISGFTAAEPEAAPRAEPDEPELPQPPELADEAPPLDPPPRRQSSNIFSVPPVGQFTEDEGVSPWDSYVDPASLLTVDDAPTEASPLPVDEPESAESEVSESTDPIEDLSLDSALDDDLTQVADFEFDSAFSRPTETPVEPEVAEPESSIEATRPEVAAPLTPEVAAPESAIADVEIPSLDTPEEPEISSEAPELTADPFASFEADFAAAPDDPFSEFDLVLEDEPEDSAVESLTDESLESLNPFDSLSSVATDEPTPSDPEDWIPTAFVVPTIEGERSQSMAAPESADLAEVEFDEAEFELDSSPEPPGVEPVGQIEFKSEDRPPLESDATLDALDAAFETETDSAMEVVVDLEEGDAQAWDDPFVLDEGDDFSGWDEADFQILDEEESAEASSIEPDGATAEEPAATIDDLDLEFQFTLDDESDPETAPEVTTDAADLSEPDFQPFLVDEPTPSLSTDESGETAAPSLAEVPTEEPDFEFSLDPEDEEPTAIADPFATESEDLDFDFSLDPEEPAALEEPEPIDFTPTLDVPDAQSEALNPFDPFDLDNQDNLRPADKVIAPDFSDEEADELPDSEAPENTVFGDTNTGIALGKDTDTSRLEEQLDEALADAPEFTVLEDKREDGDYAGFAFEDASKSPHAHKQQDRMVTLQGFEEVKMRFTSAITAERIAALQDAIAYDETGHQLIFQALREESGPVREAAEQLVSNRIRQSENAKPLTQQAWLKMECLQVIVGHGHWVQTVAIASDNRTLVSGSKDNTIKTWDLFSGQEFRTIRGHNSSVLSIALSPESEKIISSSTDNTIKIWDRNSGEQLQAIAGDKHHKIYVVTLSPDGKTLISASAEETAKQQFETDIEGLLSYLPSKGISPLLGVVSFFRRSREIKLWDVQSGKVRGSLLGYSKGVTDLAVTPKGDQMVSGSRDHTVKIWDLQTKRTLNTLWGHTDEIRAVAVSPDGKSIVSGSRDKTIKVWDLRTGHVLRTLRGHSQSVTTVAISPNGKTIISGSRDATLKIWDLETGEYLNTLMGHTDLIRSVAISPDGETIASGSRDNTIRVWRCL